MPCYVLQARLRDAVLGPRRHEAGASAMCCEIARESRAAGKALQEMRDVAAVDPIGLQLTAHRKRAKNRPLVDPCSRSHARSA